jgi:hypothetical protein
MIPVLPITGKISKWLYCQKKYFAFQNAAAFFSYITVPKTPFFN